MATLQKKKKETNNTSSLETLLSLRIFVVSSASRFHNTLVLGYLACVKGSLFWPDKTDVERILLNAIRMFGNKGMSKGRRKLD